MDLLTQLLGVAIGVASIVVTLIVFRSGLYKKLDMLLALTENLGGTLTEEQARDLTNIYLKANRRELAVSIKQYLETEFPQQLANGDKTAAELSIRTATDAVISNMRAMVRSFRLRGGQNFAAFLEQFNPLNSGNLEASKKRVVEIVADAIESKNVAGLQARIAAAVEEASRQSENHIKTELAKRYA